MFYYINSGFSLNYFINFYFINFYFINFFLINLFIFFFYKFHIDLKNNIKKNLNLNKRTLISIFKYNLHKKKFFFFKLNGILNIYLK